jgi:hypothetical protein
MADHREHEELMLFMRDDGLTVMPVVVPTHEVVFVKGVLEAYPGIASVHAERGRVTSDGAPLVLACDPGFADELAAIVDELAAEVGLRRVDVEQAEATA